MNRREVISLELGQERVHLAQYVCLVGYEDHVAGIRQPDDARPWNSGLERVCLRRRAGKIIQD